MRRLYGTDGGIIRVKNSVKQRGSWTYLVIQMFVFEWAAAYSTYFPYGNKQGRNSGKQFLTDIANAMNQVMRSS